jgi:hypothetical protein
MVKKITLYGRLEIEYRIQKTEDSLMPHDPGLMPIKKTPPQALPLVNDI